MSRAPARLRALIAWPAPYAAALARSLKDAGVDVTPTADLAAHLTVPGYYHVAYAGLAEWRGFSAKKRAALAGRVALLILGPAAATAADSEGVSACLRLPAELPPGECAALFAALHAALAEGWTLAQVAGGSGGRLAFDGAEPAWPAIEPAPRPRPPEGARGGWRDDGRYRDNAGPGAGYGPGTIIVNGDAVFGNKLVQHAAGDQINITRGSNAAKLEQDAGGDQVNVNRTGGGAPAAGGTCRACGAALTPPGKFCGKCGEKQ
jgi:hypothetical protein